MQRIQSISSKKQKRIEEQEKVLRQQLRNHEIRQSNMQRFFKKQDTNPFSPKSFKPPWGLDQQRFKKYYLSRVLKEFNLLQSNEENPPSKPPPKKEMFFLLI